ncbi:MAG: glycoside hydrolase family 127 protein [Streptosporangiaceae bacterium]
MLAPETARGAGRGKAARHGPVRFTTFSAARWRPLPLDAITLRAGFWSRRVTRNAEVTLAHAYEQLGARGTLRNFARAARGEREHDGPLFSDSDLYKWVEGACWQLVSRPDGQLEKLVEDAVELIAAAQDSDGYINTYWQARGRQYRFTDLAYGHEMYCVGHLVQAGVAHRRVTGRQRLLDVACRAADHVGSVFGTGRQCGTPGHPEIEGALVELWRETGDRAALELAGFLIDQRGHGLLGPGQHGGPAYFQDHVPVREAHTVEGHAVRQVYLLAGVVDRYLETGEQDLLAAAERQWRDLVSRKTYVTGGLGAEHEGEAFGEPYELPNARAYAETCAAIGSVFWNWRMLLATADGGYADLIEHTLYNAVLCGVSLRGDRFFYANPLSSTGEAPSLDRKRAERASWFDVACCPPNVTRLLASIQHYLASHDAHGVQIHQYTSMELRVPEGEGAGAHLRVDTDYPWGGDVRIDVLASPERAWSLGLRVPAWASGARAALGGETLPDSTERGYVWFRRRWRAGDRVRLELPMRPRLIRAHPRVDAARGSAAVQRGPLVYCVEQTDQPADVRALEAELDEAATLAETTVRGLPEKMVGLRIGGYVRDGGSSLYADLRRDGTASGRPASLVAIPYFAWANRGPAAMRVWLPRAGSATLT